MNITKKRLRQIIQEECAAVMADSQGTSDSHLHTGENTTITGGSDHEIRMAYKQLNKAAKYSQSLASRMENMPEANLPSWVQAKITKASDYISMVYHYLEEELNMDHDADAMISLEKQPMNEMIDDPVMAMGAVAGGAFGLKMLWDYIKAKSEAGREPSSDELMAKIESIMASKGVPFPPAGDEKQVADDGLQRKLAQMKAARDREKGLAS